MNLFAGWNRDIDIQNRHVDMGRRDGDGMSCEIWTHMIMCKIASGELLYSTGSPAQCPVVTWRGEMGRVLEGGSRTRG